VHEPRVARREDERLLTGRGRYAADFHAERELHAYFLRSDRAHARILALDAAAALAYPGVVAVLTGADVSTLRWPPTYARFPGRGGKPVIEPSRSLIATGRVRYVGEIVAMVAAESAAIAQDGAELIAVDYEELPVVIESADALGAGAPLVHEGIPANICFEYDFGDEVAAQSAFADAPLISRVSIRSQRLVANAMEPRACLASWSEQAGYALRAPTQGVSMMRASLAAMMDESPERVHVLAEDVGGAFGTRSNADAEYGVLLLAARRLSRPVRWEATRSECFLSDPQGRANDYEGEIALNRDGRFLALRFRLISNLGAYLTQTGAVVHAKNPSYCPTGVYDIPVAYGLCQQVLTHTAPVGAYRGAGRPDIAYFVERIVDQAAADHGFERTELRRKNLIPRAAFPYRSPGGSVYDSGNFHALLERALALSNWPGFPARAASARERGRQRGIGIAIVIETSGGGTAPSEQASIRFNPDRSVTLYSLSQSSGQGHETTFPMLVGALLGIEPGRIVLRASDADSALAGSGTVGSRALMLVGSAFKMATAQVLEKARALAARSLGVAGEALDFRAGAFVAPDGRSAPLLELGAGRAADGSGVLEASASVATTRSFPNGCHIAEVEIDPETGELAIDTYTAVDDFGTVINHTVVEGQVHGGVMQGAGQVLGEHCIYDPDTGQLLTGSFMDYYMPRADALPEFRLDEIPVPCTTNPLGAKGAGEAGTTGALPALMSAVLDALHRSGVPHIDMPVTPEKLWRALRRNGPEALHG
jgi:carbon-monoxide dehydrogenase large subunit